MVKQYSKIIWSIIGPFSLVQYNMVFTQPYWYYNVLLYRVCFCSRNQFSDVYLVTNADK